MGLYCLSRRDLEGSEAAGSSWALAALAISAVMARVGKFELVRSEKNGSGLILAGRFGYFACC